jgi:hypothetical protein
VVGVGVTKEGAAKSQETTTGPRRARSIGKKRKILHNCPSKKGSIRVKS